MQYPLTRIRLARVAWSACSLAALALPGAAQTASISPLLQVPPLGQVAPPAPARPMQFSTAMGGSYLGIGVQDVDSARARELKLKEERGVEVTAVEEDSPASRAGLRKGDVVLEMNGQRVEGVEQFVRMVRETPVGRDAKLMVSRSGDVQTLAAKVAQRKSWTITGERSMVTPAIPMPPMVRGAREMDLPRPYVSWRNGALGVEAEALKGGLAEFFGVKQGVLVRSVTKGSPAEKAGMKAGDVIVRVSDRAVESPADVAGILRERGDKKTLNLVIVREKREQPLTMTLEEDEHGGVTPRVRSVRAVRNEEFF